MQQKLVKVQKSEEAKVYKHEILRNQRLYGDSKNYPKMTMQQYQDFQKQMRSGGRNTASSSKQLDKRSEMSNSEPTAKELQFKQT